MDAIFNNGNLRVSDSSITYKPLFNTIVIDRSKIVSLHYKYDNFIYNIFSIPLGIFYCCTILGIPLGLQCIRRSMLVQVKTRYETFEFWVHGKDKMKFKEVILN